MATSSAVRPASARRTARVELRRVPRTQRRRVVRQQLGRGRSAARTAESVIRQGTAQARRDSSRALHAATATG